MNRGRFIGRHPNGCIIAVLLATFVIGRIGDVDQSPGLYGPELPLSSTTGSSDVAILMLLVAAIGYAGLLRFMNPVAVPRHVIAGCAVVIWECIGHAIYTTTYPGRQYALLGGHAIPQILAVSDAVFGWIPAALLAAGAFVFFVRLLPEGRRVSSEAAIAAAFGIIACAIVADALWTGYAARGALEFRTTAYFGAPVAVAAYAAGMAFAYARVAAAARASWANLGLTAVVAFCVEFRLHLIARFVSEGRPDSYQIAAMLHNLAFEAGTNTAAYGILTFIASLAYLSILAGAVLFARSI